MDARGRKPEAGSAADPVRTRRLEPLDRARPVLVLVTDRSRMRGRALADVVDAAIAGGVNVVQLRDPGASHDVMLRDACELRDVTRGRAMLFVNSDAEAAIAAGADGLHLPERAGPIGDARLRIGRSMLLSRAVHGVEAARQAERDGADLIQAGTVYATASKPGAGTLGAAGLRAICEAVRIPVIAIGGITAGNAAAVVAAGATGVAVIGAIMDAPDPRAAAMSLRAALDAAVGARANVR